MFENFRRSLKVKRNNKADGESTFKFKTIVAYLIFGAIILVFALFGITPERMGSDLGGNAAVVNGEAISVASFQRQLDMVERSTNLNLDQFPPAQRELFARELRRRTLEEMIMTESIFQKAKNLGLRVSDEEVRRTITSIPFFQEKERFQRQKYVGYLQAIGQSPAQFEREIRKELMAQKLQSLFVNSHRLSQEAKDGLQSLDQVSLSFRYATIQPQELIEKIKISEADVKEALATQEAEIKSEYDIRKIDYFTPERVKARHILVKVGDNQSREEAQKKLQQLRAELNVDNFSEMAKKHSDDPGSKDEGGELGFFERGRMVPAFEKVAFSLPPGEISEPVETDFGFHLILVDQKEAGGQKPFEEVKEDVARRYLARRAVSGRLADLKALLNDGKTQQALDVLKQLGVKWEEVKDINLGASSIPGISQPDDALRILASRRGQLGLVPELQDWGGETYIFDLTSWKSQAGSGSKGEAPQTPTNATERLAGDAFQKWVMSLNETMDIERNLRLLQ